MSRRTVTRRSHRSEPSISPTRHPEDSAIARRIYEDPDPVKVAKLCASHDWETCLTRWHWIEARKLGALARTGRAMLGLSSGSDKKRATSTLQEAATIETSYVLSNQMAAEVAAGLSKASIQTIYDAWGIPIRDRPRIKAEERGLNTKIGFAVARCEAWAIEADVSRRVRDRAVYDVVYAALSTVPEIKPVGRPVLPAQSDALRAAVAALPKAAVDLVFSGLIPAVMPKARIVRWNVPDDTVLKRVVQDSRSFADAAQRLGLSKTCVRRHANRPGIRTRFRYGVEKLPDDRSLVRMFAETRAARGLAPLARRLGVTANLLAEQSNRVKVDGRFEVRRLLPDDETLRRDMVACQSFADLARSYGVHEHTVRNQGKQLGIPSPTKRGTMLVNGRVPLMAGR